MIPPEQETLLSLESALMAAVTVLSGAVVCLWRVFLVNYTREQARAERCEERTTELLSRIAKLEASSCIVTGCQLRMKEDPPQ